MRVGGVGAAAARSASADLLARGAQALVSWGVAGATRARMRSGDIVLPGLVKDEAGSEFAVDAAWRRRLIDGLAPGLRVWDGALVQVSEVAAAVGDKQRIAERYAAVAADMESAAVAELAVEAGVPLLVVRSICDTLAMRVPPGVAGLAGAGTKAGASRWMMSLLAQPRDWPALFQLWRGTRQARRTLSLVAAVPGLAYHGAHRRTPAP